MQQDSAAGKASVSATAFERVSESLFFHIARLTWLATASGATLARLPTSPGLLSWIPFGLAWPRLQIPNSGDGHSCAKHHSSIAAGYAEANDGDLYNDTSRAASGSERAASGKERSVEVDNAE